MKIHATEFPDPLRLGVKAQLPLSSRPIYPFGRRLFPHGARDQTTNSHILLPWAGNADTTFDMPCRISIILHFGGSDESDGEAKLVGNIVHHNVRWGRTADLWL